MSVPFAVSRCLGFPVVGFSGSRSVVPLVLSEVLSGVASGSVVFVGCARGVDGAVRSALSGRCAVRVFRASAFGSGRAAFALRSAAFVRALAAEGGVLFSFPGRACPVGLSVSADSRACFCGLGSGSWATLSFAAGLGVPCCVWLPAGLSVPVSWGLVPVGGGWWVSW